MQTPTDLFRTISSRLAAFTLVAVLALTGCGKTDGGGSAPESAGSDTEVADATPADAATGDATAPADSTDTAVAAAAPASDGAAAADGTTPANGADEAPPVIPANPADISIKDLRRIATKRFLEARTKVPPFERNEAMMQILNRDYGVDYRNRFPDGYDPEAFMSREAILLRVNQQLQAEADVQFPPATRERLEEEVLTLFPLYRKGDRTKVLLGNGRTEEGTVQYIGTDFVQIGLSKVPFTDIVKPDPRAFKPEETQTLRDHYLRVNYDNQRRKFIQSEVNKRVPQLLRDNGFVLIDGENIRIDNLINERVMPEVSRLEAAYFATKEAEIQASIREALTAEGFLQPPKSGELPLELFVDLIAGPVGKSAGEINVAIEVTPEGLKVNSVLQPIPMTRESLVQALGDPTREVDLLVNRCLIWDDLGLSAFVNSTTLSVEELTVFYLERDRSMRQFPKRLFKGKLAIDDVTIAAATNPEEVNKHLSSSKYEKVEGRNGLWRNQRTGYSVTLTRMPAGIQTIRVIVDKN